MPGTVVSLVSRDKKGQIKRSRKSLTGYFLPVAGLGSARSAGLRAPGGPLRAETAPRARSPRNAPRLRMHAWQGGSALCRWVWQKNE